MGDFQIKNSTVVNVPVSSPSHDQRTKDDDTDDNEQSGTATSSSASESEDDDFVEGTPDRSFSS